MSPFAQNVLVVFYHLTQPAHPKFRLIPKRMRCLQLHVASGVVEIATSVAGLASFYAFGQSPAKHSHYAAPAGVIHALTGLYQTQLVFGCQLVMKPAYYWCGVMHLIAAVATHARPDSHHHLMQQYLILCIFTWCRVFIPLLSVVHFGTSALYSLSISLAGITIFPYVLGAGGPSFFFAFITGAAFLWAWSADLSFDSPEWAEITAEHVRNQLFDPAAMSSWKGVPPGATKEQSEAAARRAFDALDSDGSGTLDAAEVMDLLSRVKVHSTVRQAVRESLAKFDAGIDFNTFLRCVWNIGERSVKPAVGKSNPLAGRDLLKLTPREKARAVFDSIDLDGSGVIEPFELSELLLSWGCPSDEITGYLSSYDADGDGKIGVRRAACPRSRALTLPGSLCAVRGRVLSEHEAHLCASRVIPRPNRGLSLPRRVLTPSRPAPSRTGTFGFDHVLLPMLLEHQRGRGHTTVTELLDSREAAARDQREAALRGSSSSFSRSLSARFTSKRLIYVTALDKES